MDVCQLIAFSFPMTSKGQITLEVKLVLANDGLATPTHSPSHIFSLAKLAKEFLYT